MPKGVLITHIPAVPGLASGSFFKSTQQQNIFIPCFPLQTQKSSPSPVNMITQPSVFRWIQTGGLTFPHGAVGSLKMLHKGDAVLGLPHAFGLWSGQSVSFTSPLEKQATSCSKEGRESKSICWRGRVESWVDWSIKGVGWETESKCKVKRKRQKRGRLKFSIHPCLYD